MSGSPNSLLSFLKSTRNQVFILLVVTFLCYVNTVPNFYSLDDHFSVTANEYVKNGIKGIPDILTHHYISVDGVGFEYRPLPVVLLAIEYQFFGENPHISHIINLLFYLLLIVLIFKIFSEVFAQQVQIPLFPFLVTLLFALHPSHTEVVASIKNREELLSVFFALLALLYSHQFFRDTTKWKPALFALLFLLLSFLSKVSSMYIVGVIILLGLFHDAHRVRKQRFYIFCGALILVSAAYFLVMWQTSQRTIFFYENPLALAHSFSERIGTAGRTLLFYLKFMVFPYPFRFFYGYNTIPVSPFYDPLALFSLVVHTLLLITGIRLFRRKEPNGFFILSYLGSIFLYSNLVVVYTGIVSERALFLPGLWLIAFVALAVLKGWKKIKTPAVKTLSRSLLVVLLIGAGVLIIHRNGQWETNLSLMGADIDHLQNSPHANFIYSLTLDSEAQKSSSGKKQDALYKDAVKYYKYSLATGPKNAVALYNTGMIYEYHYNTLDSALKYFQRAYALDTSYREAQFQLAKAHYLQGDYKQSLSLFDDLYRKQPTDTVTLYLYAQVLFLNEKPREAEDIAAQLIQLAPGSHYGYMTMGVLFQRQEDMEKAMPYLEKGTQLGGRDAYVYEAMTKYYLAIGRIDLFEALRKTYESNRQ